MSCPNDKADTPNWQRCICGVVATLGWLGWVAACVSFVQSGIWPQLNVSLIILINVPLGNAFFSWIAITGHLPWRSGNRHEEK